jgi:sigma-B regulation protein RsbU (phosphoserine phosphatase)
MSYREHRPAAADATPLSVRQDKNSSLARNSGLSRRIAAHDLFCDVPGAILEAVLDYGETRELGSGDLLLSPGERSNFLYVLLEGRLGVHLERQDGNADFLVNPGEYVGEISIIDRRPATAFVIAEEPSLLLAVPESRFWDDFLGDPQVARNFMRLFADRFRSRNKMMLGSLEERLRYEHLEKELSIAEEIQAGMLPHDPDLLPEIEVVAKMVAARHVGGDFYDVFPAGDDKFCIAIGDVSGKGVPAALFMVKAMTLLRTEMLRSESLESAVEQLNIALCAGNDRCMFVTLIVGLIDRTSGEFRYVVAGHNPLVYGKRGRNFQFQGAPRGLIVGVSDDATYESTCITLNPGDVLVLYTDGVTEAMNAGHELFSNQRLLECLEQGGGATAVTIAARMDEAIAAFVGGAPQSDDVTIVVLRYLGAADAAVTAL